MDGAAQDPVPSAAQLSGAGPGAPAHWGALATLAWTAVVALAFVTAQAVAVTLSAGWGERGGTRYGGTDFAWATIAGAAVCCPLLVLIVRARPGSDVREYFALHPVPVWTIVRWWFLFTSFVVVVGYAGRFFGVTENAMMQHLVRTAEHRWIFFAAAVAAAPLFEEMLVRGFLYTGLVGSRAGVAGAIVLPAAAWTAVHMQYGGIELVIVFGMGLILGVARARTGSLVVPLALHAAQNLMGLLLFEASL